MRSSGTSRSSRSPSRVTIQPPLMSVAVDSAVARKQPASSPRRLAEAHGARVVRVDHREVLALLVLEHARLRMCVRLQRVVAIQMVW